MRSHLLAKDILHSDETTLQVLHETGREAESQSYMWLYRTGRSDPPIVLYDYQTTRASKHPARFLEGFKGYLHADGFPGYNSLPDVKLVGCWAHARRGFTDALAILPKGSSADVPAAEGLNYVNELFRLEREAQNLTPKERFAYRLEHSSKVLQAFSSWLSYHGPRALPKGPLSKAITYCRNQWEKLTAFLSDGRLELDNNRAERSIKPFVIGRKKLALL